VHGAGAQQSVDRCDSAEEAQQTQQFDGISGPKGLKPDTRVQALTQEHAAVAGRLGRFSGTPSIARDRLVSGQPRGDNLLGLG
jgi:hypothetical protein